MKLTLTTPALLFSTVSLLMVAYTTRFMGLAGLIRSLHDRNKMAKLSDENIRIQLALLRKRVRVIKNMQLMGVVALILSIFSTAFIFFENMLMGEITFIVSLIFLVISLILSAVEIQNSIHALEVQLDECADGKCDLS